MEKKEINNNAEDGQKSKNNTVANFLDILRNNPFKFKVRDYNFKVRDYNKSKNNRVAHSLDNNPFNKIEFKVRYYSKI